MTNSLNVNEANAEAIYLTLKKHLSQDPEGESLIHAFEADPEQHESELAAYLQEQLQEDDTLADQIANALQGDDGAQFANIVTGGQVDQIINVAKLGVLNMTVKKSYFAFRDLKQLALFLMTLLMVAVAVAGGYWYLSQPIVMEGDFNIVVAQFGEVTENGVENSAVAAQLSDRLFSFLESELATWDLGIEIETTHKNIPLITETSEAEAIAAKTNANLVIYGKVLTSGSSAEFYPEFYVADHSDTSELAGQNRLGLPIAFDNSQLSHEDDINDILRKRATMLLHFIEGLTYLTKGDYMVADSSLASAIAKAEELQPFEGKEILYLMHGLALQKGKDLAQAEQRYNDALNINPEYARARIGLGNIHYLQYVDGGLSDGAQLAQALSEYQAALDAADRSRGAHIEEKVNVALGNIYLIRAQQQEDPALFEEAVNRYDQVIAHYQEEPEDVKLINLAAIAYFGLGAAHERQLNYEQAREAYQQCLDIVTDKGLKQQALERLQFIEEQLM